MPKVSIIIPAYNQGRFLGDAVRSALGQTEGDIEVVIVDDGSTDDTREVAHGFTDGRVRYVYQDNRGLSAARNTGIRHARGEFLSYLDSDDLFLPVKVAVLLDVFGRHPDTGLATGHAILIDESGAPLGERFERGVPDEATDWLLGNPLHVGSVMVRRDWQERVGPFDESLRSYEDWDMWIRLARAGCPMRSVAEPVSLYRFHGSQMTRVGRQMTTATFAVLDKTFSDATLPSDWRARRDEAYSRAHLRAAAQAYTARDFAFAKECMTQAVKCDVRLRDGHGEKIADFIAGWANFAKTRDSLAFVMAVYDHLPEELASLHRRRRRFVSQQAARLAWAAHNAGDKTAAQRLARVAVGQWPLALLNRGLLRLLLGSR